MSPTIKQRKLANALVENLDKKDSLTLEQILVSVGYAQSTAEKNGAVIIGLEGTIQALAELGFTEDNAKGVVAEILLDKRKNAGDRLRAAEQIFKVTGSYAPEKSINVDVQINTEGLEELRSLAKTVNESIKKTYGAERPDTEKTS